MADSKLLVLCLVTFCLCDVRCDGGQNDHGSDVIGDRRRPRRADGALPLETVVEQLTQRVTSLEAQLQATRDDTTTKGSTYIRWGRSTCPVDTNTVYSGYAAGSWYDDQGGSANRLCLSPDPVFDATGHQQTWYSTIYGAEYEFVADQQDNDVLCAVCEAASYRSTIMVPGTNVCPSGWVAQYRGHLVGNSFRHTGAGQFLCLDGDPEGRVGSEANQDGAVFYYTATKCGSLPCPPYADDKLVLCVVCSR